MSRIAFKLPDLGEGTVAAEIVAWRVQPGELVAEDQPVAEMSTDKAVVEVPSPVSGRVVSLAGKPGESVAVGAELVVFETDVGGAQPATAAAAPAASTAPAAPTAAAAAAASAASTAAGASAAAASTGATGMAAASSAGAAARPAPEPSGAPSLGVGAPRVKASPATRRRAREAGVDLARLSGSGPGGRIRRGDLDAALAQRSSAEPASASCEEIPLIGVRRLIAQRMSEAKRNAAHFSYVEEVDVTALETLRQLRNAQLQPGESELTLLPYVALALVRTLAEFPQCNAHFDAARNLILRHKAVHLGVATQTPDGLKVPVVRDAQARSLAQLAAEIRRLAEAARSGRVRREELSGSTITLTSLGKLGGIVSTPILNVPEVAIVGVNKAVERVVVHRGSIAIRRIMNLSSSFDHRFVDGFDAAAMIQALKARLEDPEGLLAAP